MRNRIKSLLLLLMVGILIVHQVSSPLISAASTDMGTVTFFTASEEKAVEEETLSEETEEDTGQEESDTAGDAATESTGEDKDISEETQKDEQNYDEIDQTLIEDNSENKLSEEKGHSTEQEDGPTEQSETIAPSVRKRSIGAVTYANNSINMPKATYKTMILQGAKGQGQRIADSGKFTMLPTNEDIQRDIDAKHKEYSSFTPHWGASTSAVLSSYDGSQSVSTYLNDPNKAGSAGVFGMPVNEPYIVDGRVYCLTADMKNKLSCTYTNVGRYYDRASGRSYAIDMKAVLVDFTAKNKGTANVKKAIEAGVLGEQGGALFAFVGKVGIGVLDAFCDSVTIKYTYYIHGTQTPISVKGFAQFSDVDAQQGIEFSPQADYFYAINGANQYLGCSKSVYTAGNKAYVYSLSSQEYHNSNEHCFFTLFSGSELTLRYTFAKCSRADDGGENNGSDLCQYNVPYDDSTVRNYTGSESGGYMSFTARQAYLSQPEIGKTVFNGEDVASEVSTPHKDTSNVLPDVATAFTYKIRAVCPYEDASEHRYGTWVIRDQISAYLNVKKVTMYDGTGNQNSDFNIQTEVQGDGTTIVTASAKNVADQNFYEKNWYDLYITVQVKSLEELEKYHLDFADLYVRSGTRQGQYIIRNNATLYTGTSIASNDTETVVPQWVQVQKINEEGKPVQGITFGIYTSPDAQASKEQPLFTAKTGKDGIAHFKRTSFYNLAGKDGPYYIKEVSRGQFENVYYMEEQWSFEFSAAAGNKVIYGELHNNSETVLKDRSKILKEYTVIVRKKNSETNNYLKDAVFSLYQWSVTADSYMKLGDLIEKKDEAGYYYTNETSYKATEDNLGRFMVKETKAPFGCYNSGQEWIFETTDQYAEDNKTLEFYYKTNDGVMISQKGELIYKNHLQKGRLTILKTDEENNPVCKAVFGVWAVEDIYAPWQFDEKGNPLEGEEPLVAKDTLCDKITTDQNGQGISGLLYIGSYRVEELEGAPDHVMSDQVYPVTFEYPSEDETKVVTQILEVGNLIMRPAMAVAKIAERTRNEQGENVAFQKQTGRFTEKKVPGIYHAGERIRYEITVTNTGNVDIYHLRLNDDMTQLNEAGQKLEDYVEKAQASFVIPSDHRYESDLGNTVVCSLLGENSQCMILDKLLVGDSVIVYYEVPVSADAANVFQLKNKVTVTASYDNNQDTSGQKLIPVNTQDLVDEQGNLLTEDEDCIHIPGEPDHTVVKKADRTTGCTISNGMLNGIKVPGIYHAGEQVIFTISIKNSGTANLKKILVNDLMSEELKEVIEKDSASFRLELTNGYMTTENGKLIDARLVDDTHVILCENTDPITGEGTLQPGDVATLQFQLSLKKDIANLYDLENKVIVNSSFFTGEKDLDLVSVEDTDHIEVPGDPEAKLAKIADHTTGTVLVDGRYQQEKIPGSYKNGEKATFTITITNSGTADLYDLKVRDVMEERLISAMIKDSVGFQYGTYSTAKGDTITGVKNSSSDPEGQYCIKLNRLKAGDSVELLLHGNVNEKAGDLSNLENKAYVTAHYRKGNEEAQQNNEKNAVESGITYLLQYHANNGTTEKTPDSETPTFSRKKITINGNPFHKEGYVFKGWNTKADGTGSAYAPGAPFTMPSKDVHLYAQWGRKGSVLKKQYEYSLVYHSNNRKKQEQPDSETRCLVGTILTLDSNMFSYEGYHFLGWSLTPEGTDALLQPNTSYEMPKKDVHLYAQWEKLKEVTLTYHSNYKNSLLEEKEEETKTDFETPCQPATEILIKQCEFERADYVFDGWSKNPKAQEGDIKPEQTLTLKEDMDLYAIWKPQKAGTDEIKYHLIYHGNNETMDSYMDSETPCEASKEIILDANRFNYSGYEFTEWNTKADGIGKQWKANDTYAMPSRNVHLYAQWKKQEKCTLTYDSNYPKNTGKANQQQKIDCETPSLPETEVTLDGNTFQCDGYAFLGWSFQPNNQNETAGLLLPEEKYLLTEDTVLYAIWTDQLKEYTLLYSSNTESPTWETDPHSPCPAGTPHKLIQNPFRNKTQSFVGWSLKPDAKANSEDILQPGTRFEQPARNIILYAIWRQEEGVSLYYDSNGGTLSDQSGQTETDSNSETEQQTTETRVLDEETPCIKADKVLINTNPFIKKGYHFIGWSLEPTSQSQADIEILYPGCEYTMPEKNVILYAVWEKTPQVTFEENELAESPYTPIAVTELMKDEDHINIPGAPLLRIAKIADRTKGVNLQEGRYEGKRKAGTYYKGETVTYKITVSNYGTSAAFDILVHEKPSASWKKALEAIGFSVSTGETIKTSMGKTTCVLKKTKNQVILDRLDPGDRVILYYEATVKSDEVQEQSLKNTVIITGKQKDGTPIPKTKLMTDSDRIKISDKQPENKNTTGYSPKTGDTTPIVPITIISIGMFMAAVIIFVKKKRERNTLHIK